MATAPTAAMVNLPPPLAIALGDAAAVALLPATEWADPTLPPSGQVALGGGRRRCGPARRRTTAPAARALVDAGRGRATRSIGCDERR
jgi:hypothetical protein